MVRKKASAKLRYLLTPKFRTQRARQDNEEEHPRAYFEPPNRLPAEYGQAYARCDAANLPRARFEILKRSHAAKCLPDRAARPRSADRRLEGVYPNRR